MTTSLLFDQPKTFSHWWMCVPVLPSDRNDPLYRVLKRQWADHTMNCLSKKTGQWKLASSRGFYVAQREDHITPALFHIWAAFPDTSWVAPLLDLWRVPHGEIRQVNWSYSWEQKREASARPDITDIVMCWEDEHGQAVLVIEAKRPGGKLSDKDIDGGTRYLQMPSIRPFGRKFVAFLMDERDLPEASRMLPENSLIASWQALGRLQADCTASLPVSDHVRSLVRSYIGKHYADLGMPLSLPDGVSPVDEFDGSEDRYERVRSLGLPGPVERFLLSSETSFCARTGAMPQPPFDWLAEEPSFIEIVVAKAQTTREREQPLWQLPRKSTAQS